MNKIMKPIRKEVMDFASEIEKGLVEFDNKGGNWIDCPISYLTSLAKEQANIVRSAVNKTEPARIPIFQKKHKVTQAEIDTIVKECATLAALAMRISDRAKMLK